MIKTLYFSERSTICDKLCVLSAIGTAVILNSTPTPFDQSAQCSPCHIPYNVLTSPFNITPYSCAVRFKLFRLTATC